MTVSTLNSTRPKILFVTHKQKVCGVHEFGISVADALKQSEHYSVVYAECASPQELLEFVMRENPQAIIYNYYITTLPWLEKELLRKIDVPSLGIMHEVSQEAADSADTSLFDYHIAPDPTLVTDNPIVFKTGRLIPKYSNQFSLPKVTTIGSFGFASQGKGFARLIIAVQEEFDEAIIRLHIPRGDFINANVKDVVQQCERLIVKPGIKLVASHDFLERPQLFDFLAQNTLNAFFYERLDGRGISSTIEMALAVRRPIAISRSMMFRHVLSSEPPISIEGEDKMSFIQEFTLRWKRKRYLQNQASKFPAEWLLKPSSTLKQIIANGTAPLERFYNQWTEPNLILDYERILDCILSSRRLSATICG